jgi:SulP family sulfate permease
MAFVLCVNYSLLVGGYTGSMIYSQTLFSFRFHSQAVEANYPGFSRLVGISVATCEMCMSLLLPFTLMAVIPKFLFGSVMIFIGIELLQTWLIGALKKSFSMQS